MKITYNRCYNSLILQTVEAEGFAPQGKRKNRTKSSSLLLNSAKQMLHESSVGSAECGAISRRHKLQTSLRHLHHSALNDTSGIIHLFHRFYPYLLALGASSQSPDRFGNPYESAQIPEHRKCGNRFYDRP